MRHKLSLPVALAGAILATAPASAETSSWVFGGSTPEQFTASLVLDITPIAGKSGEYAINSISGTFSLGGTNDTVTSLSSFQGADNTYYDQAVHGYAADFDGISFTTASLGPQNIFDAPPLELINNGFSGELAYSRQTFAPEPPSAMLVLAGLTGLSLFRLRRRRLRGVSFAEGEPLV